MVGEVNAGKEALADAVLCSKRRNPRGTEVPLDLQKRWNLIKRCPKRTGGRGPTKASLNIQDLDISRRTDLSDAARLFTTRQPVRWLAYRGHVVKEMCCFGPAIFMPTARLVLSLDIACMLNLETQFFLEGREKNCTYVA